jgi:hypothetical protein
MKASLSRIISTNCFKHSSYGLQTSHMNTVLPDTAHPSMVLFSSPGDCYWHCYDLACFWKFLISPKMVSPQYEHHLCLPKTEIVVKIKWMLKWCPFAPEGIL